MLFLKRLMFSFVNDMEKTEIPDSAPSPDQQKRAIALSYDPKTDDSGKEAFSGFPPWLEPQHFDDPDMESRLEGLMRRYRVDRLVDVSPGDFQRHIESQIGKTDHEMERYRPDELERQRDLSIKFHWGHDHDFGAFALDGRLGRRHITLLKNFIHAFPVSEQSFQDADILDVGCWCGGTTLMLSALGGRVTAIEEVKKYADMTRFLMDSFGMDATVRNISIFQGDWTDAFDLVFYPGVIYHVTDPVLSLRILFNATRIGGEIFVESAGLNIKGAACLYEGCMLYNTGTREELNRGGWNWFSPTPLALARMMWIVGYEDIQISWIDDRVYGYGKKLADNPITRAGLSRPDIP